VTKINYCKQVLQESEVILSVKFQQKK